MKYTVSRFLVVIMMVLGLLTMPHTALAQTPADDLSALSRHIEAALERLAANDIPSAISEMAAFNDGWGPIEDSIRDQSPAHYTAIETAMGDVTFALHATPIKLNAAREALQRLKDVCQTFINGQPVLEQNGGLLSSGEVTLPSLLTHLDRALSLIEKSDMKAAAEEISAFRREWPIVEGLVKAKSAAVYGDTENNMAKAYGLLVQPIPDASSAKTVIIQMKTDLSPFSQSELHYGIFDAMIILLREGLEALLIVGALFAFLKKTGNSSKSVWLWTGSGLGVLASVAVAVIINIIFSKTAAGANRELLEGFTGLIAAGMLIYVSAWLHSKANLGAWHKYIDTTMSTALARNSLFSLAVIAFLAVFREGAETILFYVGIAPGISTANLLTGIGLASASLIAIGAAIFFVGVRIPVEAFFRVTSILIFYLAFKFIGTGVHAFQVAGKLPATGADFLLTNSWLGMYPTWQTTIAQAALLASGAVYLAYSWSKTVAKNKQKLSSIKEKDNHD
ncbi:MAG: FTR1 family protein [Chloroflexi bacterium]|nr:FTR1 family protein [Chloroflexota bacterium]